MKRVSRCVSVAIVLAFLAFPTLADRGGCPCLPVVTHPYEVVKVAKPVGHVHFQGREEEMVCP